MNTTVTRSTNKTPYEIVFGQRANTFHNVSMEVPSVNLSGLEDIVESQLEEEQVEEEKNVEFSVSPQKGAQQPESLSSEIDRKRRKLLNFSIHDPIIRVDKEAFEVTCPVREEIRETVKKKLRKKYRKNGKKYNSSRKVETREYNVGDNVSIYIPKRDRHSTDVKRLPCVVTNKGSGKQPSYKLLTEFGILQKRYTAAKLMPYPGSVKCGDPSVKISLAAVVRKVVSAKRIFCHCKGACTTLACRCKKASIKCSSQCHGIFANDCRNRTSCIINKSDGSLVKEQEKSTFPKFGGKIICNDQMYILQNTCPVDTWLFIFKTLLPILKMQNGTIQLQHLLYLIEKSYFNAAKLQVAIDQKIPFGRENIDFF